MKYACKPMRVSYLGYLAGMILVMGFGWWGLMAGSAPTAKFLKVNCLYSWRSGRPIEPFRLGWGNGKGSVPIIVNPPSW